MVSLVGLETAVMELMVAWGGKYLGRTSISSAVVFDSFLSCTQDSRPRR